VWVLILALVMLSISALLSAYISLCYGHKERHERPMIFNRHEGLFGLTDIGLFVPGIVMVFIVAGWKWGLVGLVLYWLLVVFVLMPIVSKRFFSFEFERIRSGVLEAKMKEDILKPISEEGKMSEKVTIQPQDILDFVGDLGGYAYAEYRVQAGKDPTKKLGGKEKQELRAIAAIVSASIAKGLILAKHQPELVGALVEQMNQERPGYANKLLKDMLFYYQSFLYQKAREKGWRPPGEPT